MGYQSQLKCTETTWAAIGRMNWRQKYELGDAVIAQMRMPWAYTRMVSSNNAGSLYSKLCIAYSLQNTDLNHTGNTYKDMENTFPVFQEVTIKCLIRYKN